MLYFLDLLAKIFFETYCIFCVEKYKDLIMRVQNVNTNAQTQPKFKANCVARVEYRVFDSLNRCPLTEKANLAQQMIDIIKIFTKGVSTVGKESDEATLHFGGFPQNHVNMFFNKQTLAHLVLNDDNLADVAIGQLLRRLPEPTPKYYDVIPKNSVFYSPWREGQHFNEVQRTGEQLMCSTEGFPKSNKTEETKNIDQIMDELRQISVLV